jgi:hypothetical protein
MADLTTLFQEVNDMRSSLDSLASGYFNSSDDPDKLDAIRRAIFEIRGDLDTRFFVQGEQPAVL